MTSAAGSGAADSLQDGFAQSWEAVRAQGGIQFEPLPVPEPREPPAWTRFLGELLDAVFAPLGRALGLSWPVFKWVLLALALAALALLVWRLLAPAIRLRRAAAEAGPDWQPDHAAARALMQDADQLAEQGRYDEAVHLLLQRSVNALNTARPGLLEPSSTAREIAALAVLPDAARQAFAVIAARVERSLFALRPLDAADWQVARAAYADFALAGLERGA